MIFPSKQKKKKRKNIIKPTIYYTSDIITKKAITHVACSLPLYIKAWRNKLQHYTFYKDNGFIIILSQLVGLRQVHSLYNR